MKKAFFLFVFALPILTSCDQIGQTQEKEQLLPNGQSKTIEFTTQVKDPFTDPRDGQEYATVKINSQTWLAQNLNFNLDSSSWFYDDDPEKEEKYGRLYTWEAAKIACPAGWHLPSDDEWKELANSIGGYFDGLGRKKDIGNPRSSYKALIEGGSSGFEVLFGGERIPIQEGKYLFLGKNAFFWSDTEYQPHTAIGFYLYVNEGKLHRFENGRLYAQSCRCIKD